MENNTEIQLIQAPVFKHQLVQLGASIKQRIEDLKLDEMVINEDTIQTIKTLRASLNNEKKQFDENFKKGISPATTIIDDIKATKKDFVDNEYAKAETILKDGITKFELEINTAKKNKLIFYFNDLCASMKIDFLLFENVIKNVLLSTTEKAYKEQILTYVNRVNDDQLLINTLEFSPEIITEYKSNGFNASLAITTVNTRKQNEKLEAQRIKQAETDRRETLLRKLAMVPQDMTQTFNYISDNSIFISKKDISDLSKDDFNKAYTVIESKIKAYVEANTAPKLTVEAVINTVAPQVGLFEQKAPEPLKTPSVIEEKAEEEELTARFEVKGSMAKLLALGVYLKENNYNYKNIE